MTQVKRNFLGMAAREIGRQMGIAECSFAMVSQDQDKFRISANAKSGSAILDIAARGAVINLATIDLNDKSCFVIRMSDCDGPSMQKQTWDPQMGCVGKPVNIPPAEPDKIASSLTRRAHYVQTVLQRYAPDFKAL